MINDSHSTIHVPRFAFFGTSEFSIYILEELLSANTPPTLIVTTPPKPAGRGLKVIPSLVKVWADNHGIPSIEPENIKDKEFEKTLLEKSPTKAWDLFVVASYGKIFPTNLLYLPKHKTLNVHPSLLPLLRGAAPLEHTILSNMRDTGVTIMRMDEEVDHGPIVSQKNVSIEPWPMDKIALEKELGAIGGKLLAEAIPLWCTKKIDEKEQNHALATFAPKIKKEDALINLNDDPYKNSLKINAYAEWPRAYFYDEYNTPTGEKKKTRITITEAKIQADNALEIVRVIPEGKKEMFWKDYLRGRK